MPSEAHTAIPLLEGIVEAEPRELAPDAVIMRMRQDIHGGMHWFEAVLSAIGRWRLPGETAHERDYVYLIGSEAFDWLLLAERLLDELDGLVPPAERDALLFEGQWPLELDDDEFRERIGPAKFSAHLNFLYGVVVEQALLLHVEEEVHKEMRVRVWGQDQRVDETVHQRVYGHSQRELFARYYEETGRIVRSELHFAAMQEFTYWLFKFRLRNQDKARTASDTRKGLAQLTRMEMAAHRRRRDSQLNESEFAERYVQSERAGI